MVNFPLLSHPGLRLMLLNLRLLEPLLVVLAGGVAYVLRHGVEAVPSEYIGFIILGMLAYAAFGTLLGAYAPASLRRMVDYLPRVSGALAAMLALVVVLLFSLKISEEFSRAWVMYWGLVAFGLLVGVRWLAVWHVQRQQARRRWQRKVAIYGLSAKTNQILEKLRQANAVGLQLVGVYAPEEQEIPSDLQASGLYRGTLEQLLADARRLGMEDVIVAVEAAQGPAATLAMERLLNRLHALPANVHYCLGLPFFGRVQQEVLLAGIPLVTVYHQPLQGQALWLKRALDVVASSLLLLLVSPLLVVLAALVKLSSPGPVFFRQQRGGFNGKTFEMLKFRSMRVNLAPVLDGDGKEQQARKDDARITPIGRFLRKSSLDELPQLLNVLRGDMSLVGPRPHAMSHDDYYARLINRYASRQKMKPGLTGWAQLNGWRGETETLDKMAARVDYDIWYIENYSLALDLKILFLTPFALLGQKTAY